MDIESNIPVPPKRNNRVSRWLNLAQRMVQGDSVEVKTKGAANALAFVIRYHSGQATVKKTESGCYRVWRVV